jgi:hypothetical protein
MDEKIQRAIHDLESVLAESRKHIFRATVLDRDNQLLATGQALFEGGPPVFWPDGPPLADVQPPNRLTLRRSDNGDLTPISDFHRCKAMSVSVHYHFRTE